MPARKYQEEGGPGITTIITLIRRVSAAPEVDVDRFLQANMLNWLIGGTDAHAKNHALLSGAADELRLAPFYDLSSQSPYRDLVAQRVSMQIGEHCDISRVTPADWRKLARLSGVPEQNVVVTLSNMTRELPDHISAACDRAIR